MAKARPNATKCRHTSAKHKALGLCKPCYDRQRWLIVRDGTSKRKEKDRKLRAKYGLSIDQYDKMLRLQGNVCDICKKAQDILYVDHDHATGNVRGLLCRGCNSGIAMLGDNLDGVKRAVGYLSGNTIY